MITEDQAPDEAQDDASLAVVDVLRGDVDELDGGVCADDLEAGDEVGDGLQLVAGILLMRHGFSGEHFEQHSQDRAVGEILFQVGDLFRAESRFEDVIDPRFEAADLLQRGFVHIEVFEPQLFVRTTHRSFSLDGSRISPNLHRRFSS